VAGSKSVGKAPNCHHDPDDFVIGGYGLKLSIVIPVFNELSSLPIILNKVVTSLPQVDKEIIVVDDCSTDGTREWLQEVVGDHTYGVALPISVSAPIAVIAMAGSNLLLPT
jgi:cellulose synthase/poly-beta-1,6-N-acetylglucosamine synthase-like glycosyltransferase